MTEQPLPDAPDSPKNDPVPTGDTVDNDQGTILGREPAMVLAFVQAILVLAVTFGLRLTPEQTGAILGLSAIILGLITRSKVTPA